MFCPLAPVVLSAFQGCGLVDRRIDTSVLWLGYIRDSLRFCMAPTTCFPDLPRFDAVQVEICAVAFLRLL